MCFRNTKPAPAASLLDADRINALPQPLLVRFRETDYDWPVESITVENGLTRFDVCGELKDSPFWDVVEITDADGVRHASALFLAASGSSTP